MSFLPIEEQTYLLKTWFFQVIAFTNLSFQLLSINLVKS